MGYITHRRMRLDAICGPVNIPAMTELECADGMVIYRNGLVCYEDCELAHRFLARNDDGHGMERGRLTQGIMKALARRDGQYQERWDRVWGDPVCRQFRRPGDGGHWLWGHSFFNGEIGALRHIAALVGGNGAGEAPKLSE